MNVDMIPSKHQKLAGRGLPQYDTQKTRAAAAGLTVDDLMREARLLHQQDGTLSAEQYFARMLRANRQAYAEYLKANPAQTGGRRG